MISPEFAVHDVVAAAEYYRDILGFKILGYFARPPVYAIVGRDSAVIHLGRVDNGTSASPNVTRRVLGLDAYIWVDDLDALYQELRSRGAKVIDPPTMRVNECYEMVVEDNFGFRLAFSQDALNAR